MILPTITVVLGVILIASGVLHILRERSHRKRLANVKNQRDELNRENDDLVKANVEWAEQNTNLHAQNADLCEALQEAKAEIKALNMRTVEMPAPIVYGPGSEPMPYAEAKPAIDKAAQSTKRILQRPARGKKAGTQ